MLRCYRRPILERKEEGIEERLVVQLSLINTITRERDQELIYLLFTRRRVGEGEKTKKKMSPLQFPLPLIIFRVSPKKVLRLMLSQYLYLPQANCSKEILLFQRLAAHRHFSSTLSALPCRRIVTRV